MASFKTNLISYFKWAGSDLFNLKITFFALSIFFLYPLDINFKYSPRKKWYSMIYIFIFTNIYILRNAFANEESSSNALGPKSPYEIIFYRCYFLFCMFVCIMAWYHILKSKHIVRITNDLDFNNKFLNENVKQNRCFITRCLAWTCCRILLFIFYFILDWFISAFSKRFLGIRGKLNFLLNCYYSFNFSMNCELLYSIEGITSTHLKSIAYYLSECGKVDCKRKSVVNQVLICFNNTSDVVRSINDCLGLSILMVILLNFIFVTYDFCYFTWFIYNDEVVGIRRMAYTIMPMLSGLANVMAVVNFTSKLKLNVC